MCHSQYAHRRRWASKLEHTPSGWSKLLRTSHHGLMLTMMWLLMLFRNKASKGWLHVCRMPSIRACMRSQDGICQDGTPVACKRVPTCLSGMCHACQGLGGVQDNTGSHSVAHQLDTGPVSRQRHWDSLLPGGAQAPHVSPGSPKSSDPP